MATQLQTSVEKAVESTFKALEVNLLNTQEAIGALSSVLLAIVSKDAPTGISVTALGMKLTVVPEGEDNAE